MSHLCIACASASSCGCNRRRSNNTKHKVHKGMHNERSQNAVPLIRPRRRSPNAVCHSHNNSTPHGKCSPRGSHFQCFCNIAVQFDAHMPSIVVKMLLRKLSKTWLTCLPYFNSFLVSLLGSFGLTLGSLRAHFGFTLVSLWFCLNFRHHRVNILSYFAEQIQICPYVVHTLFTRCRHFVQPDNIYVYTQYIYSTVYVKNGQT